MLSKLAVLVLAAPCLAANFFESSEASPILAKLDAIQFDILDHSGNVKESVIDGIDNASLQIWLKAHGIVVSGSEALEEAKKHKQWLFDDVKEYIESENSANAFIGKGKEYFEENADGSSGSSLDSQKNVVHNDYSIEPKTSSDEQFTSDLVARFAEHDVEVYDNKVPTASVDSLLQDTFNSLLWEFEARIARDVENTEAYINDAKDFANAFIKDISDQTEEDIGKIYNEAESQISAIKANSGHEDVAVMENRIREISEQLERQTQGLSAQLEYDSEQILAQLENFMHGIGKSSQEVAVNEFDEFDEQETEKSRQKANKKKSSHRLPEFTTFVTRPEYWRTERLAKYLQLRGFDSSGYKRDELLDIISGVYKNVESSSKFAVILDSWGSKDLRQILLNANEDATGTREELLNRVSQVYSDIVTALSQQPELLQKKINEIVDVLKLKSFDNFKNWDPRELREYLDSYGARTDSDYYTLIEAAKDNYYHFIYGFASSRDDGAVTVWSCIVSFFKSLFGRSDSQEL